MQPRFGVVIQQVVLLPFAIGHPKHKKFFSVFDFVRPWWQVAFLCLPFASPANLEILPPTFHRIHVLDGFGWFCCTVMSMEYRKFGDHYEVFLHRILSDSWESHGDVSCVIYQISSLNCHGPSQSLAAKANNKNRGQEQQQRQQ